MIIYREGLGNSYRLQLSLNHREKHEKKKTWLEWYDSSVTPGMKGMMLDMLMGFYLSNNLIL